MHPFHRYNPPPPCNTDPQKIKQAAALAAAAYDLEKDKFP